MTDDLWRPLFAREDPDRAKTYDALSEGVPPWLVSTVLEWTDKQIPRQPFNHSPDDELLRSIERQVRIGLDWSREAYSALKSLLTMMKHDAELALNVVDALLCRISRYSSDGTSAARAMGNRLDQAGSAWRVVGREGANPWRLERRVLPQMEELVDGVARSGERPADYLAQAWGRAFGRQPNPDGGYRDAVRAIEAALKPVVLPSNDKATLGTIIPAIRDKPAKFATHLKPVKTDPVLSIVSQLEMLWTAQLDRHGTDDETVPLNVSVEESQDAAVIAATIVQLVQSGGFRRA